MGQTNSPISIMGRPQREEGEREGALTFLHEISKSHIRKTQRCFVGSRKNIILERASNVERENILVDDG